ncbi:MAG: 4Fe-4S binding protein [Anaerolineae bacterium]|nr:4Fe-4S binding protein [Anaerolineae bacterium]
MEYPPITPWIDRTRCIGCGECVRQCPTGALMRHEGKAAIFAPDRCTACAVCEEHCPVGAVELPFFIQLSPKFQER